MVCVAPADDVVVQPLCQCGSPGRSASQQLVQNILVADIRADANSCARLNAQLKTTLLIYCSHDGLLASSAAGVKVV